MALAIMAAPEIWKAIASLPGVLASSRGRVMLIPGFAAMPHGGLRSYGARARRGQWDGTRYILTVDGHSYKVARLVCEAFNGPPPFDGAVCMHMDENARNNAPLNLQWGTQQANLNAPGFIEYCRGRTGDNNPAVKGRKARAA